MNNVYSPPESEVTVSAYGNINLFNRFSAWYTIILILLTLGLYLPYWLHTRTKILNQIVHHQISTIFTGAAILLYIVFWVMLMAESAFVEFSIFADVMQYFTYLPILDMISNVVILVWVFKFRNRLQKTFSSSDFGIGIIPTFFFQIIYLQYKINQLIDDRQHNKPSKRTLDNHAEREI